MLQHPCTAIYISHDRFISRAVSLLVLFVQWVSMTEHTKVRGDNTQKNNSPVSLISPPSFLSLVSPKKKKNRPLESSD